jgi:hypothetical protein
MEDMPRWMMSQGWTLPEQSFVHPNILPTPAEAPTIIPAHAQVMHAASRVSVKEFVFFGRLERRKGLWIFLDVFTSLFLYISYFPLSLSPIP